MALNIPNEDNTSCISWSAQDLSLSNDMLVETTVMTLEEGESDTFIYIDGDLFVGTHYILTKKDGLVKFISASEIDNTYERYSYSDAGFVQIELVEEIVSRNRKISINCEPYDNFFTENMLVFDRRDN
jgi:hypothetical protein